MQRLRVAVNLGRSHGTFGNHCPLSPPASYLKDHGGEKRADVTSDHAEFRTALIYRLEPVAAHIKATRHADAITTVRSRSSLHGARRDAAFNMNRTLTI